jgi:SAM-dependent methyltransferase
MASSTDLDRFLTRFPRVDGYWILDDPGPRAQWEARQWHRRAAESRLYTDSAAQRLPEIAPGHVLEREWNERADMVGRLSTYLSRLWRSLVILEVGCGMGWLSNRLVSIRSNYRVYGLDQDRRELKLACRVFIHQTRLRFLCGDAQTAPLPQGCVDIVVMAGALQSMTDPDRVVAHSLDWLAPSGELHILDTPLARPDRPAPGGAAVPWEALAPYRPEVLFDPHSWANRLAAWWRPEAARMPHPWIKIAKP